MDWLLLQIKIMLRRSYSIGGENWFNKFGISLFMAKRYEDTQLGNRDLDCMDLGSISHPCRVKN